MAHQHGVKVFCDVVDVKFARKVEALGADAEALSTYYHATEEGNWEHGRNIFYRTVDAADAKETESLLALKKKLLAIRNKRIRPGLDDKIVTGWNAMTIAGLVDAYKAFGDEQFLKLALNNISFLEVYLMGDGKVYRTYKNKHSETEAFLEDYAYLIQAYTALYQVTYNEGWLHKAEKWCHYVLTHFYDKADGFFHFSSSSAEQLIAKKKEVFDNVIPASNSVMARNLHVLGTLLDQQEWKEMATKMVSSLSAMILSEPSYMSNWGIALLELKEGLSEIVIAGEDALSYCHSIQKHFFPFSVTAGTHTTSELTLLTGREAIAGRTMIYVCKSQVCKLPVEKPSDALTQLMNN